MVVTQDDLLMQIGALTVEKTMLQGENRRLHEHIGQLLQAQVERAVPPQPEEGAEIVSDNVREGLTGEPVELHAVPSQQEKIDAAAGDDPKND